MANIGKFLKQDLNPLPSNFTTHSNNRINSSLQVSNEKKLVNFRDEIELKLKRNLLKN